jgi:hypothetical protein
VGVGNFEWFASRMMSVFQEFSKLFVVDSRERLITCRDPLRQQMLEMFLIPGFLAVYIQ